MESRIRRNADVWFGEGPGCQTILTDGATQAYSVFEVTSWIDPVVVVKRSPTRAPLLPIPAFLVYC